MRNLLSYITFITLTIFSAVALSGAEKEESTPYLDLVDDAEKACADGDWSRAIELWRSAILLDPDNPGNILLMNNVGMIQHQMGMDTTAVATLTEAHRRAPSSVTILMNRAKVLTSMGESEEAMEDYRLVTELDSAVTSAWLNHGILSLSSRRFNDAKADFAYLEEHFPSSREAKLGGAMMRCAVGDFAGAVPLYTSLIEDFKETEYYSARAYCNLQAGNLQDASDDLQEALELDPDDGELYLYRAALNKLRYRPEDARRDARKAVSLGISEQRAAQFLR